MYFTDSRTYDAVPQVVGAGGVTAGDMVVRAGTAIVRAANAPAADTIVGIANETVAQGGVCQVTRLESRRIRANYTGIVKTFLVPADIGVCFDLSTAQLVDLDDIVGGPCMCVGYDNLAGTIEFIVPESFKYC